MEDGVVTELKSVAPSLLVAMPQLDDPNFRHTVVLLCQHSKEGAWGLVLNRPTGQPAAKVVQMDPALEGDSGLEVWIGGPVEPQRGFLLLGEDPGVGDSEKVSDGLHLTASVEVLRRVLEAAPTDSALQRARLLLGYAGWGPGQLDQELTASAWLTAPPDPDLVFATPAETMWEVAIRGLGVDPMMLQVAPGVQ
jgi:putative transcriptional regulator